MDNASVVVRFCLLGSRMGVSSLFKVENEFRSLIFDSRLISATAGRRKGEGDLDLCTGETARLWG